MARPMLPFPRMSRTRSKPPWEQPSPRRPAATLSPAAKKRAAALARLAGRRYPNLVDSTLVAAEARGGPRRAVTRSARRVAAHSR